MSRLVQFLGVFALVSTTVLYYAGVDTVKTLSPQGCGMSWMSPSYILQSKFDHTWSPLGRRYSLWLYREVGWEGNELHGTPVLFIPGNAGSSHQVRSIASSATRQFYSSPYQVAEEFRSHGMKPLDFFAVEFNEDLSAFHGSTLGAQTQYTARAIEYILSLYPPGTSIVVLGHSMGGVVAMSLLPHPNISAIITMSTPHTLAPARFDRRIDRIYRRNLKTMAQDPTPILSLCGGATDLMVPSESCVLPSEDSLFDPPYRRTVFTSALEGTWTGVGHLEMVWCHQVRWRIARAVLELRAARSPLERGLILDVWLRDGHTIPPAVIPTEEKIILQDGEYTTIPPGLNLVLKNPVGSHLYALSVPETQSTSSSRLILYLSQGSIGGTSPHNPLPLRVSIFVCTSKACATLKPSVLKLVPSPIPGRSFPVPDEGSDESEGVAVLEADIKASPDQRVVVRVENADGRGWVVAGFIPRARDTGYDNAVAPLVGPITVQIARNELKHAVAFPGLLSNALVVYRLSPKIAGQCSGYFEPLLEHTSHSSEIHYYPLIPTSRILLHTHAAGPFVRSPHTRGLNLTIYATGESSCAINALEVEIDWWATIGRWGVRYAAPTASWAVGVVALVLFDAWGALESSSTMPSASSSLSHFCHYRLPWLLPSSLIVSFLPLPSGLWLGNVGEPLLTPLAPLMLSIAIGFVSVSWWFVKALTWPLSFLQRSSTLQQENTQTSRTSKLLSLAIMCILIFLIIPWQVAYLGCWLYHLYTCSTPRAHPPPVITAIPLVRHNSDASERDEIFSVPLVAVSQDLNQLHQRQHLLLLMTWLLPLAAPVLAVWVRTLYTAGLTTPFDGDHNVLNVAPYLILVDSSWGWSWLWKLDLGRVALKGQWTMLVLAVAAFFLGPRATYIVFEVATIVLGAGVLARFVQPYYDARWHPNRTPARTIPG